MLKARTSGKQLPIDIVFVYEARRNLVINPRNVSVDLKYDFLCLGVFVYGIPA